MVPGASGQGSVIGGPLKIEYPVLVDVKVDSIWRWRIELFTTWLKSIID